MAEHDPQVLSYRHLAKKSRADEALKTLKKVASVVKPIMRAHGWKVKELAEFYPSNPGLLGLWSCKGSQRNYANVQTGVNVNRGAQICLRLRYPGDESQFLPLDNVVDTMLHELCHMVHGPHNAAFHALWEKLRDEHTELVIKGFTGEGFLSEGRRLGGLGGNLRELRRLSRQAVDKRSNVSKGGGHRLGGKAPAPSKQDMRQALANAVERRTQTLQGCAAEQELSDAQVLDLSQSATSNGFRTQAEEDEANNQAIAAALVELMEIEERHMDKAASSNLGSRQRASGGGSNTKNDNSSSSSMLGRRDGSAADAWACSICTLYNPPKYLCCDACGAERSEGGRGSRVSRDVELIDLT